MPEITVQEALNIALRHYQACRFSEAEAIYQRILTQEPGNSEVMNLLGVALSQQGQHQAAMEMIHRAIEINPQASNYHNNLGQVLLNMGRLDEAISTYRKALELKPDDPELLNNLGNALNNHGRHEEATFAFNRALKLKPDFAAAYYNLGIALMVLERTDAAIASFQKAIYLGPNLVEARVHLGNAFKIQNRLTEAIHEFRLAARLKPDAADIHNALGNALQEHNDFSGAIDAYRQTLKLWPDLAEVHGNLGLALNQIGRTQEAIDELSLAVQLKPDFAEAHNNLGNLFKQQQRIEEALVEYRVAIGYKPELAEAYNNMGNVFQDRKEYSQAITAFQTAIRLNPDFAEAYYNLGNVFKEQNQSAQAIEAYRSAVRCKNNYAEAHNNLGIALHENGQFKEAMAEFRAAIHCKADYSEAYNNLGALLLARHRHQEALAAIHRALEINPDNVEALNNLGNAFKDQGKLDEAVGAYHKGLMIKPDFSEVHSNLVYTLNFHPAYDMETIYHEHVKWNQLHAAPLRKFITPHIHDQDWDRNPDRKLRIGYVSPDFRDHVVGRNLLPLFKEHDRKSFEVICYAQVIKADLLTEKFRSLCDQWRDIRGIPDEKVTQMIRNDGIDILVDLAMHMAGNRLPVFARKPAPVQATFMAYPGTTGLDTMDYRLTDPYLDPPNLFDAFYSEESIRLPDTFWCYDPLTSEPAINELPALKNGTITFGCLNNFCKINDGVLQLWAKVLSRTPQSRLLLLAPTGALREDLSNKSKQAGVDPERLEFVGFQPRLKYLTIYHGIDVGLDSFPYNGHTTSLDSFWMGVPVVTLIGNTVVGRAGLSQLHNLDLKELAARTPEEYVDIATKLAGDLQRLGDLRRTLRQRMQASALMDAERFARNVEAAYRQMWRGYAESSR